MTIELDTENELATDGELDTDDVELSESDAPAPHAGARAAGWRSPSESTLVVVVVVLVIAALGAVAGWLGWQMMQAYQEQERHAALIQSGRQAAIDLTTIGFGTVDADIQRVLDSSVGPFHDEFQSNAKAFADLVRKAQSTTVGTVTEAGIESSDADSAQILVTATVKSTTGGGGPPQEPRIWRMRITVRETPEGKRVSDVGFVS